MITVGIVLYNPDLILLDMNLNAIISQRCCEEIYTVLVDNCSSNIPQIKGLVSKYKKIELIENGVNKGIATALNQIMEFGKEKKCEWVMTLDQDSTIPLDMIDTYLNVLNIKRNENIGMLCPKLIDRNTNASNSSYTSEVVQVNKCITSGTLCNLEAWEKSGKYDDYLFIDFVDFDMCAKIRMNNYKIYQVNSISMIHSIGVMSIHKLFGFRIISTAHSPFRHYYYSRNLLYFSKKYGYLYPEMNFKKMWFLEMLCAILYEDNKIRNVSAMIRGLVDSRKML